jgi:hypothetical protein
MLGHGGIGTQDKTVFLKGSTLQTADWQHFLEYCDPYAFDGILEEPQSTSYFLFTNVFRIILAAVSNTDQSDEAADAICRAQETTIAHSMSSFERNWPQVLMSGPVIHTLIHYPRFIYRWNSVRNYWCYFNERSTCTTLKLFLLYVLLLRINVLLLRINVLLLRINVLLLRINVLLLRINVLLLRTY